MNKQDYFDVIEGNLHLYDMREELFALSKKTSATDLISPEHREFHSRILHSHALLLQYYIDLSFNNEIEPWDYTVEVRVRRTKKIQLDSTSI